MANQTRIVRNVEDRFPIGSTVSLYKSGDAFKGGVVAPTGTAVASATVAADGSLTFSAVPDDSGTHYVMFATVGGRPVTVQTGGSGAVSWASRH